jgi:nitrogen regulatory protein PII
VKFKAIMALVSDEKTEAVVEAARESGATGFTVISTARGEGLEAPKTFFGLALQGQRDVVLFLVEEHLSRHILETIANVGRFDEEVGTGIAFQFDIEDAVGLSSQIGTIQHEIEDQI